MKPALIIIALAALTACSGKLSDAEVARRQVVCNSSDLRTSLRSHTAHSVGRKLAGDSFEIVAIGEKFMAEQGADALRAHRSVLKDAAVFKGMSEADLKAAVLLAGTKACLGT